MIPRLPSGGFGIDAWVRRCVGPELNDPPTAVGGIRGAELTEAVRLPEKGRAGDTGRHSGGVNDGTEARSFPDRTASLPVLDYCLGAAVCLPGVFHLTTK